MSQPDATGVRVDLADDERQMLILGLDAWDGLAQATERLAAALGFAGVDDLATEGGRIATALAAREPLSVRDWTRALVATEVAFTSNLFGAGGEWMTIYGGGDGVWMRRLRGLQATVPTSRRFLDPRADLEQILEFEESQRWRRRGGEWRAFGPGEQREKRDDGTVPDRE